MTAIVTTVHRYKRPPRKKQAVPLTGPVVVTQRATKLLNRSVQPLVEIDDNTVRPQKLP